MQRYKQTAEEILEQLSWLDSSWQDDHSARIVGFLESLPADAALIRSEFESLLVADFDSASDIIRLLLDMSADDYRAARKRIFGEGGSAKKRFEQDRHAYMSGLDELGLSVAVTKAAERKLHWSDIYVERLKGGRGSAIKGQRRGRQLEGGVEAVVLSVFGRDGYRMRRSFLGRSGRKTEKADVAIPTEEDPRILIEVKAYGATGSKQTDVIGDVKRIVAEKRSDTAFLLVLDGLTWREQKNDLRNLVAMQREGEIARIYTTRMFPELRVDLEDLRRDHHLPEHMLDNSRSTLWRPEFVVRG